MVSKVFMICDAYESGYGHGLKEGGKDLSETPHSDPELGEAYQIGYEAGEERAEEIREAKDKVMFPESVKAFFADNLPGCDDPNCKSCR